MYAYQGLSWCRVNLRLAIGCSEIHSKSCPRPAEMCTAKPVRNGHSKIDKTKILKTNGSLMKVESNAESSV